MVEAVKIKSLPLENPELTVLKTLVYFDIFNYPITEEEIRSFAGYLITPEQMNQALRKLLFAKIIFKFGELYSLQDSEMLADKRIDGNRRAKKLIPKAGRIGAFLNRFPYVRAVAVSGSLSKNYADPKADIDFFIITKANRLWIARTFLHCFKKLTYLIGREHYYCMNYFIDEHSLLIAEQNVYSATEVVTLLPAAGGSMINQFFTANRWTLEWLPAYIPLQLKESGGRFRFKKMIENFLDKKRGDKLDDLFFKWTTRRWEKKERMGRKNVKGKVMNLVTDKHFSKSDPGAFQQRIVDMYHGKLAQLRDRCPQYFDF